MIKFFRCPHCGNFMVQIDGKGGPLTCCGQAMSALEANLPGPSVEKHMPKAVTNDLNITVEVGSAIHPQTEAHYIQFVYLVTQNGGQLAMLPLDKPPVAQFALTQGDKAIAAYEYCNLHGLWMTKI